MKKISLTICFVLCTSMYIPAAMAEDISIPNKNYRQGMSYEEYSAYREKMRIKMKAMGTEEPDQDQVPGKNIPELADKASHDGSYGQGYHARQKPEARAASRAERRPERPRFERFTRGDTGRR